MDIGRRKFRLVTVGTYRVKRVSVRSASTVCRNLIVRSMPALPVFFSGEHANGGALPLSIAPSPSPAPPPLLLRPPTKSPATQATAVCGCARSEVDKSYNHKLKARGVLNKVLTGMLHSKVQLRTLLYVTFDRKSTPLFVDPLLANDTPFTYLVNASLL